MPMTIDMTVQALLQAYRDYEISPRDVIKQVLEQCRQYDDYNIWISLLDEQQLEPYLATLDEVSVEDKPLYGIPFAIKDNIDLASVPTTAGCREFAYMPDQSAFVVQQLIDAGAIPLGKTNLDQFATGLVGTRSPWGECKNAFDPAYISGGSSSGSAVAVALGLVSFSLGTDTAGSGRVPAAFNNLVGVKPTRGLLSTSGVVPACRSLDCVTIFAQLTDDANAVLDIACAYDAEDDYARKNKFANNHRHYGRAKKDFVFAVPASSQLEFFGNESAGKLFHESVEKLQQLGGVKKEIDFEPFLQAAKLLYEGPWVAERYIAIEDLISSTPEVLLPVIKTIIGSASDKSAVDAYKAIYQLQHYKKQADLIIDCVDFLVTPTAATIFKIDEVKADPIKLNSQLGYYTNYMNLLDYASIAVPAGFLDSELPWGITLVANAFADKKLLSYANLWQQQLQFSPGKTGYPLAASKPVAVSHSDTIPIVVCGAHLDGLPLNWQLTERGAGFIEKTTTSLAYRMYALAGGPPFRPGLIRDENNGVAIEVEVWQVPAAEFGSFVSQIPAPLGIGKVELADGRWLPGFVCEAYGVADAEDISQFASWRTYIQQVS